MIECISSSIYKSGKYTIRYNRHTHYMECNCVAFTLNGKCDHANEVRAVKEKEGCKVVFKRVAVIDFDGNRESFAKSFNAVMNIK
ncbi:MAG: hypothetical protein H3C45_12580 [Bacteroidia bacterium]|nr:hypothetical protein [Bacteroidia bacterium]